MLMNISDFDHALQLVEQRWLTVLYEHVKKEFSRVWLPSHDHTHHLRVWHQAKELIRLLYMRGCPFDGKDIENLIVAVFFHDTGLTVTLDTSHGKESRKKCIEFLNHTARFSKDSYDEILEAVEKHDDKSYCEEPHA
jgi:HD superfamily phosphodiesterase